MKVRTVYIWFVVVFLCSALHIGNGQDTTTASVVTTTDMISEPSPDLGFFNTVIWPQLTGGGAIGSFQCNDTGVQSVVIGCTLGGAIEHITIADRPDVTGPIPTALASLSYLNDLTISNCALNGRIPSDLVTLFTLKSLNVAGNLLTGPLPSWSGTPTKLWNVDVSHNLIGGELHGIFAEASSLTHLRASHNKLTGQIPSSYCSVNMLRVLDVSANNLTGGLPSTLGACSMLDELDVSDNQLSGEIPPGLYVRELFNVSFNALSGTVPSVIPASVLSCQVYGGSTMGDQNCFLCPLPAVITDHCVASACFESCAPMTTTTQSLAVVPTSMTSAAPTSMPSAMVLPSTMPQMAPSIAPFGTASATGTWTQIEWTGTDIPPSNAPCVPPTKLPSLLPSVEPTEKPSGGDTTTSEVTTLGAGVEPTQAPPTIVWAAIASAAAIGLCLVAIASVLLCRRQRRRGGRREPEIQRRSSHRRLDIVVGSEVTIESSELVARTPPFASRGGGSRRASTRIGSRRSGAHGGASAIKRHRSSVSSAQPAYDRVPPQIPVVSPYGQLQLRAPAPPPARPLPPTLGAVAANTPVVPSRRGALPKRPVRDLSRQQTFRNVYAGLPFAAFATVSSLDRLIVPGDEVVLGELIGTGQGGDVHSGQFHGVSVAVKRVRDVDSDQKARDDLVREATTMHAIPPHQNVLPLLGVISAPFALVMPLCPAGNLRSHLYATTNASDDCDTSRLWPFVTPRRAHRLLCDISAGLAHLHANNVVHRDLAARNVLLGDDERALLTDFGLSRIAHGPAATKTVLAAVKWVAPEHLNGRQYEARSDLWSFGCTVIEVCDRHAPWHTLSNAEAAHRVTRADAPPCRLAVGALRHLLTRCFKADASQRIGAAELYEKLEAIADLTKDVLEAPVSAAARATDTTVNEYEEVDS